ncbi:MAG: DUF418 domain-containing protein [Planifilum fimeticola]
MADHPHPGRGRKLAPDLARGLMLLLVALAHAHQYLEPPGRVITDGDRIVVFLRQIFIDGRAFPVFFLLFGYGLVQIMRRCKQRGEDWGAIRGLLKRRGWWLLVIGFLHAVTLFDFTIGIYGFATVLLIGTLRWSDRTVKWGVIASLAVVTLLGSVFVRAEYDLSPSAETVKPNVWESLFMRVFLWVILTPLMVHQVVPAMLIGMWAARTGILDHPGKHRRLLARTAAIGLAVSTAGAIPLALISSGFWADPPTVAKTLVSSLHTVTGYAGGLGWAALIGWTAALVEGKPHPVTRAIAAVGQRSMSFYILQSVVFFIAFTPDIGGLGNRVGQFGSDVVAWLTWMASVAAAEMMRRSGTQGPAEAMLRRLVYRKRKKQTEGGLSWR